MAKKLSKRRCKQCGETFQKKQPLQYTCSIKCAVEYTRAKQKDRVKKEHKDKIKKMRVSAKSSEHKKQLQSEINKLARQIDTYFKFNCIDCGASLYDGTQTHASHFHDVGGNNSIRYNLHNVHASKSACNLWGSGRKKEYKEGLIKRYSKEYQEFVEFELKRKYPHTKLSDQEVYDKLKVVRKLNRDFATLKFEDGISARNQLNNIIGIYS